MTRYVHNDAAFQRYFKEFPKGCPCHRSAELHVNLAYHEPIWTVVE